MPDRTFKIKNWYFPVCSRCTGIYVGLFLFFVQNLIISLFFNPIFGLMLIFPTLLDGTTQFFGLRESNNHIRLLTGLLAGYGYGILILDLMIKL